MKFAATIVFLGVISGCASWGIPRLGPTRDGIAMPASTRDAAAARRGALMQSLPLFLAEDVRRQNARAIELIVSAPQKFVGAESFPKKGDGVVEVRVDILALALRKAGLVVPAGFDIAPENVLIAFGDRGVGPNPGERLAAQALETALFGRGVVAQDADDELRKLAKPLTAKNEAETVAQAIARGVPWLAMGRASASVGPELASSAWRAKAELRLSVYALGVSTLAVPWAGSADVVDVSSYAAVTRALEAVAQDAAARLDAFIQRQRGNRATLGVLVSGRKDPAFLIRLLESLRRTPGVAGASLALWRSLDDMAMIHVYAQSIKIDELAARLLRQDPSLRIESVETGDNRLTVSGPEIAPDDRGL